MTHYLFRKQSYLFMVLLFIAASCSKATDGITTPTGGTTGDDHPTLTVTVTTIAGKLQDHGNAEDGNGVNARFWNPTKMVFDNRNNRLYVADGTTIRSIDAANNVTTYMPLGAISRFSEILDIDIAPGTAGGTLYFTTKENDLIKIEPTSNSFFITKIIDRIYGGNETGPINTADQLDGTNGVATGANGEIYFFNTYWNTLHSISITSENPYAGTVSDFAGKPLATRGGIAWPFTDGPGGQASFGASVTDISSDANGNIYIADYKNDLVRKVTPGGNVSSLFQYKDGWGIDKDGPVSVAQAYRVTQVTSSADGSVVFFTTFGKGGNYLPVLRMLRPGKDVTTLVEGDTIYGDGPGKIAGLATVGGIAATADGKTIYIAESGKKVIRKVTIE
ncbi:hypothetical protein BH11BAC3_BH11BAC3_11760 [soil metagenome]